MQWNIDPAHSHLQFSIRHLGLSTVRGTFGQLTGTIKEENGNIDGADIDIDVASISTNIGQRDEHLKSADFFDVSNFPNAHFRITKSERHGDDLSVTGDLTIRGVTKPIVLKGEVAGPIKDPWGSPKVSASIEGKLSRKDWGLLYNQTLETGGLLLSDEVKLVIDVQAAPAPAEVAA